MSANFSPDSVPLHGTGGDLLDGTVRFDLPVLTKELAAIQSQRVSHDMTRTIRQFALPCADKVKAVGQG